MVQTDEDDQVAEEAVFSIQGVLSGKNLPPVTEKIKWVKATLRRDNSQNNQTRSPSQARYLRQGVALVGYGTTTFNNAIISAQEIYGLFDRNLPEGSLEPWALGTASMAQGTTFEASNRYFTSKRDAPDMEPVPISPLIDPRGILEGLKKEELLHGEENQVYYYRVHESALRATKRYETHILDDRSQTLTKTKSVETVNPQIFRVGDIVEAQVSFIAVPLKDSKYKLIVVLRSIALLNANFSQVRTVIV
jgi:hypothetical protein